MPAEHRAPTKTRSPALGSAALTGLAANPSGLVFACRERPTSFRKLPFGTRLAVNGALWRNLYNIVSKDGTEGNFQNKHATVLTCSDILFRASVSAAAGAQTGEAGQPQKSKVFVVGNVKTPGIYVDAQSVSALIASAGGLLPHSRNVAYIYRHTAGSTSRTEIRLNLSQILSHKSPDVDLQPNDILYVPSGGTAFPSELKIPPDGAAGT